MRPHPLDDEIAELEAKLRALRKSRATDIFRANLACGNCNSPEANAKKKAAALARWRDPEQRERWLAGIRKSVHKRAKGASAQWADPTSRAKLTAAIKVGKGIERARRADPARLQPIQVRVEAPAIVLRTLPRDAFEAELFSQ